MTAPILIIAWGNDGRCDDGVALHLADRLAARYADEPAVEVRTYHQLGPEVAEELAGRRLVFFIDAHVQPDSADLLIEPVRPAASSSLPTHHCRPEVLFALADALRIVHPEAFVVSIRAYGLDFGDQLTDCVRDTMLRAERWITRRIEQGRDPQGTDPSRDRKGAVAETDGRAIAALST